MGILGRMFGQPGGGRAGDPEQALEEAYISMHQTTKGMSRSQARELVRQHIQQAKKEAIAEGTDQLPPNYGDSLLQREQNDPTIKQYLAKVRSEGVTDQDIRWWWNLRDLERRLMGKDDELNRMALFLKSVHDGLTKEQAAARVRKFHPKYGDPGDTSQGNGDDRPLHYELKDRINRYISRRATTSAVQYKSDMEGATSFNALLRRELRAGRL